MPNLVTLPAEFLDTDALLVSSKLFNLKKSTTPLIIDYSKIRFAYPFGTVILACTIKNVIEYRKLHKLQGSHRGINTHNNDAHSYLAHIGFFQYIGLNIGNIPGEATGSSTYIPITILKSKSITHEAYQKESSYGKILIEKTEKLGKILSQSNSAKNYQPIAYCMREIIRNSLEHSNTGECILFSQSYTTKNVEMGIVDLGIGIKRSLSDNYTFKNDDNSLLLAIEPGISRRNFCQELLYDDDWTNSGFGLYVTSEIGKRCGSFMLISHNESIKCKNGKISMKEFHFPGTAVKLRIKKPKGINFRDYISNIIEEGEEIAVRNGRNIEPSPSTLEI